MGASSWVIRDVAKRAAAADTEVQRRAYLYVARNTTLPAQVRHRAQLALNTLNGGHGMAVIKNRCVETSRGRGVLARYGLCRFQFRKEALHGRLPGVHKASW